MSDPVHITVVLSPDRNLTGEDVADLLRDFDGVVSVTVEREQDQEGDRIIEVMGVDEMNKKAALGYRVVAGWSYGAGAIAIMERG